MRYHPQSVRVASMFLLVFSFFLFCPTDLVIAGPYPCEPDLIEVMFAQESQVRLRSGVLIDLAAEQLPGRSSALTGAESVLQSVAPYSWSRICEVPESRLDELHDRGEAKSGQNLYNLNNIYRLRIDDGKDVWAVSAELEALPGILLARPVPRPVIAPYPTDYQPQQNYEDPAASTPTGIDAEYAWTQSGGAGTGVTVCDLEYGWNYSHQDILKLVGSQINPNPTALPSGETDDHGTAVTGILVSDNNSWGTAGICHDASLKTCGTYYGSSPAWNVPGALAYATAALSAGDVILIENQWDYSDPGTAYQDLIPIEWWLDYYPNSQSMNGVYTAIQTAIANGIHVVEVGGNGGAPHTYVGINTDNLTWYGNSGAIIVGAGGAYSGGFYPEGDLEKLNFSSYGSRFDLQGWGENVVTCGYNDLYSAEGKNLYYTSIFAGTSSASPIVAGAVACCSGFWQAMGRPAATLTPALLRTILTNTGTAQVNPGTGHIGPRPNLLAAFAALSAPPDFSDVTAGPLADPNRSKGVAWGDYDNDGDLDLYIANYAMQANRLLRNDGGGVFTDVTSGALGDAGWGGGVAWADYDNDGDLDLYVANFYSANKLFQNDGGGTFSDVSAPPIDDAGKTTGVAWGDYDNDGLVDLYITNDGANKLFHNDGAGAFSDVTAGDLGDAGYGLGVAWGDYDDDGDPDLFFGDYYNGTNKLLRNDAGTFVDATSGPLSGQASTLSVNWIDYDNDLDLDLYITIHNTPNKLFRNDGGGSFTDVASGAIAEYSADGAMWADYDNDGDLDAYLALGGLAKLIRNDGSGTFTDATAANPLNPIQYAFSCDGTWGDYDNDGDLDLYVSDVSGFTGVTNKLYRNETSGNNWLKIKLVGTVSNTSGIGARVEISAGGGTLTQMREVSGGDGYCAQNSLIVHFGLGSYSNAEQIDVSWPSGLTSTRSSVAANQQITIYETTTYLCGDADMNGQQNISDAVYIINWVFKGGPSPTNMQAADADCNGQNNISDAVRIVNWIFKGGPAPCCP